MWEANLAALKKHYSGLWALLQQHHNEEITPVPLEIFRSASGQFSIKAQGILLHSSRDPKREAHRLAENIAQNKEHNIIILFGFGLGYAAEAVLETMPDSTLIIVERRLEIFKTALQTRSLVHLFETGKHIFIIGGEAGGILAALQAAGKSGVVLRNHGLVQLDKSWYQEAERQLELWQTKDQVNTATLHRFGKRWVRNLAKNRSAICRQPGVALLGGQFNYPVLLLAAGPSLDEIAPYLKTLQEHCIIVAVDTALRFLAKENIHADFAVTADPQYWNLRHLDRSNLSQTILIAEPSVQNAALRAAPQSFLCSSTFPLGKFFEKAVGIKGTLGAGGSVATSAFDFAQLLHAGSGQPLYIAGLDLSFPGLRTHYKGALFEERNLSDQTRFEPAETRSYTTLHNAAPHFAPKLSGGSVLTDKRLALYARWFENQLKSPAAAEVYSLSPEGLAIDGLKVKTAAEVLQGKKYRSAITYKKTTVLHEIETTWNSQTAQKNREETFQTAQNLLINHLKALQKEPAKLAQSPIRNIIEFLPITPEESIQFHLTHLTAPPVY